MTTFILCKGIIAKGNYVKEDMLFKLDVFLLANRLTQEEYIELVNMIG